MSAGKGDARRPTNDKVYGKNYDSIFRNHLRLLEKVHEISNDPEEDPEKMEKEGRLTH